MKRPWQLWLLYALGIAIVLPVMGGLTFTVLGLDAAEAAARRQAEREELVGRALWRMDAKLSPILAQEAARPSSAYESTLVDASAPQVKGGKPSPRSVSPLLLTCPDYVKLHFESHVGRLDSPQCVPPESAAAAEEQGITRQTLATFAERKQELEASLAQSDLLANLPTEMNPGWAAEPPTAAPPNFPPQTPPAEAPSSGPRAAPEQVAQAPSKPQAGGQAGRRPQVVVSNYRELDESALLEGTPPEVANETRTSSQQGFVPVPQQPTSATGPNSGLQPTANAGNNSFVQSFGRGNGSGDNDLYSRNSVYQKQTQDAYVQQRLSLQQQAVASPNLAGVQEGLFRPIWLDGNLLLARQVRRGEERFVQGCWLDWPALRTMLREEVADLLPDFEFTPVLDPRAPELSRVLATIPVQITLPPLQAEVSRWTPVRVALVAAWLGITLAALAAGVTLAGIIALSERRAAFVSAVTHELRTPLTTFRMYAEMLAEGMVPDPQTQKRYLETLRTEADRLAHLVDNVLQYARLERGRPGKVRQRVEVGALALRLEERAASRAEQVGMTLDVNLADELCEKIVTTDPAAVEQIVFNLVDNACKYAAHGEDRRIELNFLQRSGKFAIQVRDYGPGIPPQGRRKLFAPFSKSVHEAAESAPGVGLGLALSRRLAEALGGTLRCEAAAGRGAAFTLEWDHKWE